MTTELLSMLVPLDTLSGWPAAPDPTVLQSLGLLIGFPALAFVIVFAVAKIGTTMQAGQAPVAAMTDPVWVGGRETAENEDAVSEDLEADADADAAAGEDDAATSGGGAGARW